jgi:hypothetical protein
MRRTWWVLGLTIALVACTSNGATSFSTATIGPTTTVARTRTTHDPHHFAREAALRENEAAYLAGLREGDRVLDLNDSSFTDQQLLAVGRGICAQRDTGLTEIDLTKRVGDPRKVPPAEAEQRLQRLEVIGTATKFLCP